MALPLRAEEGKPGISTPHSEALVLTASWPAGTGSWPLGVGTVWRHLIMLDPKLAAASGPLGLARLLSELGQEQLDLGR
jgi:hypothetical protein